MIFLADNRNIVTRILHIYYLHIFFFKKMYLLSKFIYFKIDLSKTLLAIWMLSSFHRFVKQNREEKEYALQLWPVIGCCSIYSFCFLSISRWTSGSIYYNHKWLQSKFYKQACFKINKFRKKIHFFCFLFDFSLFSRDDEKIEAFSSAKCWKERTVLKYYLL